MKTDPKAIRQLEEAILLDQFNHELQSPKELEEEIKRLKIEISKLRSAYEPR